MRHAIESGLVHPSAVNYSEEFDDGETKAKLKDFAERIWNEKRLALIDGVKD